VKRNQSQKLSRNILQNKIAKDLFIVGKNSVLEIFDENYENFETLIAPNNFHSPKIDEIVRKFRQKNIPVVQDGTLIEFAKSELGVDSAGIIVLLRRPIEKYLSIRDLAHLIDQMPTCTVVALPDVQYEHNLGAMIRTCLGLNVDFILVPNRQQKVFSSTVTKISMGYNHVLPIVRENFLLAIEELKKLRFDIVGMDMGGENIVDFVYNSRVCIVMGNEGAGLTDTVVRKCDKILSIPMNSVVESLNVSTSLGIVLYDRVAKLERE
jgi:23S rRNA (guanosine2251-2'-O)-methyltransferase